MENIIYEENWLYIIMELGDMDLCEKINELKDEC